MRTLLVAILLVSMFGVQAPAQRASKDVTDLAFDNVQLKRVGEQMSVSMQIDLSALEVKTRRSVHIVPVLKNAGDSLELAPVGVYSNGRYVAYLRNGKSVFEDLGEKVYREEEVPEMIEYQTSVPYADWMDGSRIYVSRRLYGCCEKMKDEKKVDLTEFSVPRFEPLLIYVEARTELPVVKERVVSVCVHFENSSVEILPDYMGNKGELAKITALIDSVRNIGGVVVKKIYLKGYASPVSPYDNNEHLAMSRTEALKQYIMNMYKFDERVMDEFYEPENWEDLRGYVEASSLPYKRQILATIDGDRDPDTKEWIIKSKYKEDYKYLTDNVYPSLRKTDCKIVYAVTSNVLDDASYNLNEACSAIAEGRYRDARRHLLKAGDTEEAVYVWGVYYLGVGDYVRARSYLKEARGLGIAEADQMLKQCDALEEFYDGK